jgi:hypothetical protein
MDRIVDDGREAYLFYRGVIILIIGSFFVLCPPSLPALESLSQQEMSNVSGREGLTVDLDLDATANSFQLQDNNGFSGSGNSGRFSFSNVTLGAGVEGSGGQANLTGMIIDADGGSNELFVDAPSGQFTAHVQEVCLDDPANSLCNGGSFGELEARNIDFTNVGTSQFRIRGHTSEGLTLDMDLDVEADRLRYTDVGGNATGNDGTLELRGVNFGDMNDNSPINLPGTQIDADGNEGLVLNLFDASSQALEFRIDEIYPGDPAGSNIGQFEIDDFHLGSGSNTPEFRLSGLGNGVNVNGNIYFSGDYLRYNDSDGAGSSGGRIQLGSGSLEIHNGSNAPISFSNFTIDFESNTNVVLDLPSLTNGVSLDANTLELGTTTNTFETSINNLRIPSVVRLSPKNEGINTDLDLDVRMDSIVLTDGNGATCGSCSGTANSTFQLGSGTNGIRIDNGSGGQANLDDMTVDVDQNEGVVVGGPSGNFDVQMDEIQFGGGSGFGQELQNVNVSNTDISVRAN